MTQKTRRKLFLADKNIVSCNDSFIVGGNWKFCQKRLFCLKRVVGFWSNLRRSKFKLNYQKCIYLIWSFSMFLTTNKHSLNPNSKASFSILTKPNNSLFLHNSFYEVHWTLLNRITLGKTITDPNNWMLTITKNVYYMKYAIERHVGLVQYRSVWST